MKCQSSIWLTHPWILGISTYTLPLGSSTNRDPYQRLPYQGSKRMVLLGFNAFFFARFGVFFKVRRLETWEQNSSHCNVFWGILNLQPSSSQGPHKSSDVMVCQFAWFLRELHQTYPIIALFRENSYYRLKYIKHYKCPKIIGNYFNTSLFYW